MKLLLDTCVWGKAADGLRSHGHDVAWAGDWPQDPGDEEILRQATAKPGFLSRWTKTSANW